MLHFRCLRLLSQIHYMMQCPKLLCFDVLVYNTPKQMGKRCNFALGNIAFITIVLIKVKLPFHLDSKLLCQYACIP